MKLLPALLASALCHSLPVSADAPVPELFGIGIMSIPAEGAFGVKIREVLPDGPAAKAVLTPGMIILSVDGVSLEDKKLDVAVKLLRGPADSIARLEVKDPKDGSVIKVDVIREKIPLPPNKPAPAQPEKVKACSEV